MRNPFDAAQVPVIALAFVMAISACASDSTANRLTEIPMDTLANGAVRVSNPESGIWAEGEGWTLASDLSIGSVGGNGPDMFGNVAAIEIDALGRIYAAETQASEIRVFDADGTYVRTIGRKGRGPGELDQIMGMGWTPAGELLVADGSNGFVVFDTTGIWNRATARESMAIMRPWPGLVGADGEVYDVGFQLDEGAMRSTLVRHEPDFSAADTIALPQFQPETFTLTVNNGPQRMVMVAMVPFSPVLQWRVDPAGYIWSGVSSDYRIVQQDFSGDTVRIVERAHSPVPVTEADIATALEGLVRFESQGGEVDRSRIPNVMPAFSGLFLDDRSNLWVNVTPGPAASTGFRADVFDPEGRYLGQVQTDLRVRSSPIVRGDFLYAVVSDELDVSHVVRMRIDRG